MLLSFFIPIVYAKPHFLCITAPQSVKLHTVMKMKGSKDLLSSILKTTQMGQIGIRCVLKAPLETKLRTALKDQLKEYDSIETEAHALAANRGWELEELDPAVKFMSRAMTRSMLSFGNVNSKTAAMMINGNTRGMIKSLKNLHQFNNSDERVSTLSQKLLDCETANIKQMQGFL